MPTLVAYKQRYCPGVGTSSLTATSFEGLALALAFHMEGHPLPCPPYMSQVQLELVKQNKDCIHAARTAWANTKAGERLAGWLKRITGDETEKELIWGTRGGQAEEKSVCYKAGHCSLKHSPCQERSPKDPPACLWLTIQKDHQGAGKRRDGISKEGRSWAGKW